jgi:CheY-like chemotaxis protein
MTDKKQVLVVDDNPDIRSLIIATLGNVFFQVTDVANGIEALKYLETHDYPDLILLDLAMPGMSGLEVLERIKSQPETFSIEVIVLSAQADDHIVRQAKEMGARAVIHKPFGPLDLLQLIEDILD